MPQGGVDPINLGSYKGRHTRRHRDGWRALYLPPYSPDFNPIEMAFAKLKALLRKAARTIPDLWQAIADALRRFTPQECSNYLAAAGYEWKMRGQSDSSPSFSS